MLEFLFLQHSVYLFITLYLFKLDRKVGAFALTLAFITVLKDFNIQFFSNAFMERGDDAYLKFLTLYSILFIGNVSGMYIAFCFGNYSKNLAADSFNFAKSIFFLRERNVILICLVLLFVMSEASGFGFLSWIIDPRSGYQYHRSGIGPLYMLYNTFTGILFFIFWCKKSTSSIFLRLFSLIILFFLAYQSGNKGMLLTVVLASLVIGYIQFFNLNIKLILLHFFGGLVLYTSIIEWSLSNLPGYLRLSAAYFAHFNYTEYIVENIDKIDLGFFDYIQGLYIESIPRRFWAEKPYFFGDGLLSLEIFSAMEGGHTVGFLPFTWSYVTLGTFGPFIKGFFGMKIWVISVFIIWFSHFKNKKISANVVKDKSKIFLYLILFAFACGFIPSFFDMSGSNGFRTVLFAAVIFLLLSWRKKNNNL